MKRKPREDFVTIPLSPRYELNSHGVLRNRATGKILKWQESRHRTKQKNRAEIREIVREEFDRRAWETFKSLYPPEFVQGLEQELQKQFPALKFGSRE